MHISYKNLTATKAFATLKTLDSPPHLSTLLTPERIRTCSIPMGGGLTYNYAAKRFDSRVLEVLQRLADEQQVIEKYRSLLDGEIMNTGEGRMVLHHLLRGQLGKKVIHQGKDLGEFYRKERERFYAFAE